MKFLDSMVSRVRARFYKLSGIFREVLFLILLFLPVQFALMSRQPRTDVMTFTSLDLSSRSLPGRPRRSANVCDVSCQALCRHCPFIPVFKDTWGQNKCQSRLTVFFCPLCMRRLHTKQEVWERRRSSCEIQPPLSGPFSARRGIWLQRATAHASVKNDSDHRRFLAASPGWHTHAIR